jgi:hypothetical protein
MPSLASQIRLQLMLPAARQGDADIRRISRVQST